MKKKFLASALAASMVGTMFASMPAFAEEESSSAVAEEVTSAEAEEESSSAAAEATTGEVPNYDDVWAEKWADVDTSEHVVINYMVTGDAPTNDATQKMLDELNAILTEKVNAELQIYYIGWTDYLSNYNLTLARMDGSVDLVGTATDWLDAWPNAQQGAFLELSEDMLKTYAPLTYAQVPAENWDKCKYNGEIYFLPEDHFTQWTNHGFMYRMDWAKEAGLENGKITKFGGAGGLVPITGFANSVASAAIEYQKEGQVFGIGVKIFTIAGPVILYGIFSSFVTGLIYLFTKQWGWFL